MIGRDMNAMLEHVLKEQAFVTVPFFQLRTVLLPKEFEDAIQDTEVRSARGVAGGGMKSSVNRRWTLQVEAPAECWREDWIGCRAVRWIHDTTDRVTLGLLSWFVEGSFRGSTCSS